MKARLLTAIIIITSVITTCSRPVYAASDAEKPVTLRICNWEEYIDQGDWGEDEVIDLESGDIFGENSMVDDFEEWYYETYGQRVNVEYSTFGTNEDLYNMLTIGDVYDLVCPSEYMIMKLMADDLVQPLSDEFFDPETETNYYIKGVSPYIRNIFETHDINGVTWDRCAAGYMWGITGFVYNPDVVSEEDASTWKLLENPAYRRQVTIKDNVRDAYFAAVGALKSDLLTSDEFRSRPDYAMALQTEMNDVSQETVDNVQHYLQQVKDNLYSFETDSGKADMITGKVVANYQWSGDAVYAMDQAEEDDYYLNFAAPKESTNIYFDGWVMLKKGISQDPAKQQAAEAFINFISRPDNAIRNMYYIGYTSVISGGDDGRVFEYLEWNYGAEDEDEATDYPVGYFFSGDPDDEDYVLTVPEEQLKRQLGAQYPSSEVIDRASIMVYFDQAKSEVINRMWIRVRCFNILTVPVWVWATIILAICAIVVFLLRQKAAKEKLYS
ncbi:extracellular solute-binding protein [Butyrivibrio sp. NC2007]|uniref:extracellular solute-binding protein n=1 Tax=Butyrivibrio sp. NC2007 TaxID=1280683 RepID=UPI0003B5928E|nr:extracellular solute-binding protein [Butyrivibrio sp. NC2007]